MNEGGAHCSRVPFFILPVFQSTWSAGVDLGNQCIGRVESLLRKCIQELSGASIIFESSRSLHDLTSANNRAHPSGVQVTCCLDEGKQTSGRFSVIAGQVRIARTFSLEVPAKINRPGARSLESALERSKKMLWTIFVILLVLWVLGLVSSYTLGGFIHLLLVLAVVVLLIRLIQGRRIV